MAFHGEAKKKARIEMGYIYDDEVVNIIQGRP
jgi:hypothetical protein